jgi:hypothetical protein
MWEVQQDRHSRWVYSALRLGILFAAVSRCTSVSFDGRPRSRLVRGSLGMITCCLVVGLSLMRCMVRKVDGAAPPSVSECNAGAGGTDKRPVPACENAKRLRVIAPGVLAGAECRAALGIRTGASAAG